MTVETSQTPSAAIDSDRWPAVAKVPRGPLAAASAAIANRLLRRTATHLPLRLVYSDGTATGAADPRAPSLFIHRPDALARRIGRHGLIGFGESYMAGEWSSKELTRVLTVLAGSVDELVPRSLHWLRPITPTFRPSWPDHSRDQARRNIAVHYDLSNDLFAAFLDETMTYSCAMFTDLLAQPTPAWTELAAAQRRKIDRLLDVAGVQQGSHVLEIGTGWGELCIRAAARGAHIRSVTLSVEQQRLARQRVAAAGFGHRVEIDLCDYRDVDGQYDSVVSVEMIEAVGYRSWPRYFAGARTVGAPGWPGSDSSDHHAAPTECWPPATPRPGSRSTSSLADCYRPRRPSSTSPGNTPGCASSTRPRCDRITPRRCGSGGNDLCSGEMGWRI